MTQPPRGYPKHHASEPSSAVAKQSGPIKRWVGWDIGGAHLKAALIDNGQVEHVTQLDCPLWLGLDRLEQALAKIMHRFGPVPGHGVTMTGEMCDIFPSRAVGVRTISALLERRFGPDRTLQFYSAKRGMVSGDVCRRHWRESASANWHASAIILMKTLKKNVDNTKENHLLIDIGSTTTDIIPISTALPVMDDFERLRRGWLCYTGVMRTPLPMVSSHMRYRGEDIPLMAENFADMGDVYRICGDLKTENGATSDHRGKSLKDNLRRLARMIGRDAGENDTAPLTTAAIDMAKRHHSMVMRAVSQQIDDNDKTGPTVIIGAGCGRFLAKRIAHDLGAIYTDYSDIIGVHRNGINDHVPAVAVGLFAAMTDNTPKKP